MRRWKCHKVVGAERIEGMVNSVLHLQGGESVTPEPAWWDRQLDKPTAMLVGGYFVLYEDGYQSWSPAAAFEAGYAPLED